MKKRVKIIDFIPVLLWMAVIFYFSSQPGQVSSTNNHFIVKFLSSMSIDIAGLLGWDLANFLVRKAAHVTEYFILFILIFRAFIKSGFEKAILLSGAFSLLYSITDEAHQLFVPGRGGSVKDVFVDSMGILMGMAVIWIIGRLKAKSTGKSDAA